MSTKDTENALPFTDEEEKTPKDADQNGSADSGAVSEEEKDPEGWDTPEAWKLLLSAISRKRCTPFLGAGACAGVLPVGKKLAQSWADEFGYPFSDSTNLPRVAQYVGMIHGAQMPPYRIEEEFANKCPVYSNPDEPHRVLAEFELPIYITTNYDSFMVDALKARGKQPRQEICQWHTAKVNKDTRDTVVPTEIPTSEKPVVYHLHGSLEDLNSMVITEDDYLNFLINISEQKVIPSYIERAFAPDRVFLFIGYSLEDMSFKVLFRKLGQQVTTSAGDRHIAVQLHADEGLTPDQKRRQREFLQRLFQTQKVKVYWGDASKFLRRLRQRRAESKLPTVTT
jgi:SIR2-like domain